MSVKIPLVHRSQPCTFHIDRCHRPGVSKEPCTPIGDRIVLLFLTIFKKVICGDLRTYGVPYWRCAESDDMSGISLQMRRFRSLVTAISGGSTSKGGNSRTTAVKGNRGRPILFPPHWSIWTSDLSQTASVAPVRIYTHTYTWHSHPCDYKITPTH